MVFGLSIPMPASVYRRKSKRITIRVSTFSCSEKCCYHCRFFSFVYCNPNISTIPFNGLLQVYYCKLRLEEHTQKKKTYQSHKERWTNLLYWMIYLSEKCIHYLPWDEVQLINREHYWKLRNLEEVAYISLSVEYIILVNTDFNTILFLLNKKR